MWAKVAYYLDFSRKKQVNATYTLSDVSKGEIYKTFKKCCVS